MEAIASITNQFTTFAQRQQESIEHLQRDMGEMKEWTKAITRAIGFKDLKAPIGATHFKEEVVEDGLAPQAVLPSALQTEPETFEPSTGPPQDVLPPTDYSEEEDQGDPKPPGPPAIPVNHTTGAAKLLNCGPIAMMTRGAPFPRYITRRDLFPIVQEERRGLLKLFGKGEGYDLARGYNVDVQAEHLDSTPSDLHSEASSPAAGEDWGQVGGLTPPGNSENPIQRGDLNANGMPDFRKETVDDLVDSYMNNMNIMHPLITEKVRDQLIENFLKSVAEPQPKHRQVAALHQQGSTPESPGSKRKRSRDASSEYQESLNIYRDSSKPGHPQRTISTALVLAMLALGAICKRKEKIRDVSGSSDQDTPSYRSSPQLKNGYPPSPIHGSPIMPGQSPDIASPQEVDRLHPHSRRTSMDRSATHLTSGVKPRNMDMMPGLHYFAMATDILGNQLAGNTLQHVHVGILLSLYHGQLGRVLESWPYLNAACRSLVFKLRNRLGRWEKLMAQDGMLRGQTPAKDNGYLFAFWTCLQLESDILAELPVEQSGILKLEAKVPWPNMVLAKADGFDEHVLDNYSAQLFLRKRLNEIHTMFYSPDLGTSGLSKNYKFDLMTGR